MAVAEANGDRRRREVGYCGVCCSSVKEKINLTFFCYF